MATNLQSLSDLARKQAAAWTLKVTPKVSRDPLETAALAWKTVTKTGFAEKLWDDAMKEQQRVFAKRQSCEAKWWTFDLVSERCSTWITEKLTEQVSIRTSPEERERMEAEWKIKLEKDLIKEWDISALREFKAKEWFDWEAERKEFEALIQWLEKSKEAERKTWFEERLAQRQLEEKATAEKKALEAAAPWITRWVSDVRFARWVEWLISKQAEFLETQAATKRVEIEETWEKIRTAVSEWRADLATVYQKQLSWLRAEEIWILKQKTQSILDVVGSNLSWMTDEELIELSDSTGADLTTLELTQDKLKNAWKTEEEKTLQATQKTAQSFVKWLNNNQLWALTSEQATELNKTAWLPEWTLSNWVLRAQEINKMDKDKQKMANSKLQADIDKINAGVNAKIWPKDITVWFSWWDEKVIWKWQDNPYLGKKWWSLTFRTNNPWAITAPAWNLKEANRLAEKHWAIVWLYSQDINWWLVLNFESEEAWQKAMVWLLDEYWDISLKDLATKWTWWKWAGHKSKFKEAWFDLNQSFQSLLPDEKLEISKAINEVEAWKNSTWKDVEPTENINWRVPELTKSDVSLFNNSTFKPQKDLKTSQDKAKYQEFLKQQSNIFENPDPSVYDLLRISSWWKDLTDSAITKLDKFWTVLSWTADLMHQIEDVNTSFLWWTWPITWMIASINPFNTDAQVLKRQLIALIPNLARWVYWEVWVLTDNDVKLYASTLPNLTQTEDVNNAVLWITLRTIQRSYQNSLKTQAAAWRDVSWFIWAYRAITNQVEAIEAALKEKSDNTWWQSVQENNFELNDIMNKYNLQ